MKKTFYAIVTTSEDTARVVWERLKLKGEHTINFYASQIGAIQTDEGPYRKSWETSWFDGLIKDGYVRIDDTEWLSLQPSINHIPFL